VDGERFQLLVQVPANARATIRLPRATLATTTEGGQPIEGVKDLLGLRQDGDAVVVEVGSGEYRFASIVKKEGRGSLRISTNHGLRGLDGYETAVRRRTRARPAGEASRSLGQVTVAGVRHHRPHRLTPATVA
jgi:hypothetical protein